VGFFLEFPEDRFAGADDFLLIFVRRPGVFFRERSKSVLPSIYSAYCSTLTR
jgi:hypothetical protein